ncbi:MAG: hypothetical protein QM324_05440 [Bacteroidota bacterium]|nr:hypothetical protein [Bacteroidota bacterium]
MRKWNHKLLLACMPALLCGCISEQLPEVTGTAEPVPVLFSLSLPASPATRATDEVTQVDSVFRGIENITLIPFATHGAIAAGDERLAHCDGLENITSLYPNNNSKLYERKWMPRYTSSFLFYGTANAISGKKEEDGSLIASGLDGKTPAEISFSPDPILQQPVSGETEAALLAYLNGIAYVEYTYWWWQTITSTWVEFIQDGPATSPLIDIFYTFTNQEKLMAGSSESLRSHVEWLYTELQSLNLNWLSQRERNLRTAILNAILSQGVILDANSRIVFPTNMSGYPGDGLPAGSAAVRWDGSQFVAGEATGALLAQTDRYCYPIRLWYYTNSRINTTENESKTYSFLNNNVYSDGSTYSTWQMILSQYEKAPGSIRPETVGAALINPVQYGPGLLEITLNRLPTANLPDRNNQTVKVNHTLFPVTGLIIGGQRVQNFGFTPTGQEDYYIYDTKFSATAYLSNTVPAVPLRTLVLESIEDAVIHFAVELQNNTDQEFEGATGRILPGSRFYLLGKLDLNDLTDAERMREGVLVRRVFEQDRKTSVTLDVTTLANAYNAVPDLREPQLQIGVTAYIDWVMSTPAIVPLY